jgi:hypothetical protein
MRYLLFSEVGDDYVFRRMIKRVPIFFSLCLLISHAPRLCASQMPAANEVVRRSTRPAAMNEPPERNTPSVRSPEVVRDIQDFVEWISKREHLQRIAILGLGNQGALGRIFRNTLPRTQQPLNSMQHVVWCLDRLATPEGNARSGRSNQAQEN